MSIEEMIGTTDFKRGKIQQISEQERQGGCKLQVRWPSGVQIKIYYLSVIWLIIEKDRTHLVSIVSHKWDEKMQKRLKECIRDVDAGVYDKKKTTTERIVEIIEKRNLTSYMNNTKWKEFRNAMEEEMPFPPPYIMKTLFEEAEGSYYEHFNEDVGYLGAYDAESFAGFSYRIIEWIKVRPRYYEVTGGRLVSQKVLHDAEEEFLAILHKYNINYEEENGAYTIYGYR